ncbi:MAG: universal stress protein [Synechococcus sp.]|nr:universal stress protein [Synechococcus sp.]
MFKTILFPVDKSREAREAAETVIQLVQSFQSHLVLLSVVEPSQPEDREGVMNSEEAVANLLKGAHELFIQAGIEADTIEREGMPSFTICDVADEIEADLIVMGCRGMGLTQEGVAESVTSKVINLAPCPVLIVP